MSHQKIIEKIKPIHPFAARMAPEIAFEALKELKKSSTILDHMVGSGTVLRTVSEHGYNGIGFDIDPLAHLPDEVLGLINSFVLHKINDATVVSRLKRSIGGVEESLWNKLPNLAQRQAIISTPSLTRPLLVAMNPTPCKLLMVD